MWDVINEQPQTETCNFLQTEKTTAGLPTTLSKRTGMEMAREMFVRMIQMWMELWISWTIVQTTQRSTQQISELIRFEFFSSSEIHIWVGSYGTEYSYPVLDFNPGSGTPMCHSFQHSNCLVCFLLHLRKSSNNRLNFRQNFRY